MALSTRRKPNVYFGKRNVSAAFLHLAPTSSCLRTLSSSRPTTLSDSGNFIAPTYNPRGVFHHFPLKLPSAPFITHRSELTTSAFVPNPSTPPHAVWWPSLLIGQQANDAAVAISAGANHVLLVHRSGQLYTWGVGASGRLGLDLTHRGNPQVVGVLLHIEAWGQG